LCAVPNIAVFCTSLIMWFIIIIAVKHSTWMCDRHGGGHGMHTKLRWQQVLKRVLEDGTIRHADHLGPETTCGSFLVLDFDIGGFGFPVTAIQSGSTFYGTVAYGTDQKTRDCSILCFRNFPEFLRELWARKDI
jgi:hypothetical protein